MIARKEDVKRVLWLPVMSRLLTSLPCEYRTPLALCVAIMGDFVTGSVLERLLGISAAGNRTDGFIWKTDKAFEQEMGLTYSQMARVRKKLEGLVHVEKMQALGAPTWHYRIDEGALVTAIAQKLARPEWIICEYLKNDFDPVVKNVSNPVPKIHNKNQSISDSDDDDLNKKDSDDKGIGQKESAALNLLMAQGLSKKTAKGFVGLPIEAIQALISKVDEAEVKTSRVAYLTGALKNQVEYLARQAAHPEWSELPEAKIKRKVDEVQARAESFEQAFTEGKYAWAVADGSERESNPPERKKLEQVPAMILEAAEVWAMVHQQMVSQYGAEMQAMKFLGAEGDCWRIGVETARQQEMFSGRVYRSLKRIVETLTGNAAIALQFEVCEVDTVSSFKPDVSRFLKK